MSGGLDSILAARLIREQGFAVSAYRFITPFFGWAAEGREAEESARQSDRLGFRVTVESLWPSFLGVVLRPRFGYGRNMNPCLDCKVFMLRRAGEIMRRDGAAFVFTGEVLGQRPMSQRLGALKLLERESGLEGVLVRPLSAKCLPPTRPEMDGRLDRGRLHDIRGRSREVQIRLAALMGVRDYPAPAGGCLLADPGYARRLRGLLGENPTPEPRRVEFLALGRHFRLGPGLRLVVGRNEAENDRLIALAGEDVLILTPENPGPASVILGEGAGRETIGLAARVAARYADHRPEEGIPVSYSRGGVVFGDETVLPMEPAEIESLRC